MTKLEKIKKQSLEFAGHLAAMLKCLEKWKKDKNKPGMREVFIKETIKKLEALL